ncbi:MAG: TIGR02147 family protein [Bacteriovoracaceae bacterium]|nr:TIGR02147 family protein [Bacteriovoracaceae bacterium]
MSIFSKLDYRKIFKETIKNRKRIDSRINFQNMSIYMHIQKPYLSKIIHGNAHMNSDQLFLACEYLGFNEEETSYLHILLEYDRTVVKKRKKRLLQNIKRIQNKYLDTKKHISKKEIASTIEESAEYYLDPIVQIIHICLSIKKYNENPSLLVRDLGISKEKLIVALEKLGSLKIIVPKDNGYQILTRNIHLSKTSPICTTHQNLLRLLSINKLQNITGDLPYNFSVTFSSDIKTKNKIQEKFLSFLNEIESLVKDAPTEDVFQLNFDLFPWNKN